MPSFTPPIPTSDLGRCLVTGAAGFVGRNLVRRLLDEGLPVRALIRSTPLELEHGNLECIQGDICDAAAMRKACAGVDTVFHTAALIALLGGRTVSKAYRDRAWEVNVQGTQNMIDASIACGTKRLIHTSSVDVCFAGDPLPNMDETTPYGEHFKSVYGETKSEAERRVLASGGSSTLRTCAIRPDGIYGAENNEMFDRFLAQLTAGVLVARIGSSDVLQDNSHIDSLVHGHLLAARNLVEGGVACGEAYFIGDEEPMNSFEFFRPVIEGLGYPYPKHEVPAWLIRPLLHIWQALHFTVGFPQPAISPHELDKVAVTHYASIEKARRHLGYEPQIGVSTALEECLKFYEKQIESKAKGQAAD